MTRNITSIRNEFFQRLDNIYSLQEISYLFYIFCEAFLGYSKLETLEKRKEIVDDKVFRKFRSIIDELKTGKPFQQILGETEFYGLKFFVNEHVLIPRPETEELLELAIRKIQEHFVILNEVKRNEESLKDSSFLGMTKSTFKILDIGTGSGIIPIVLKKYFPKSDVSAIDISSEALEIAKRNAEFHQIEINFINKDYLNENLDEVYDVIISNPPYIGIEENPEIEDSVKGFEPNIALFSPNSDALIFYRKIAEDCKNHLSENGLLFLEINQKLGKETLELYQDSFSEVELLKDISGNDRMIFGRK